MSSKRDEMRMEGKEPEGSQSIPRFGVAPQGTENTEGTLHFQRSFSVGRMLTTQLEA